MIDPISISISVGIVTISGLAVQKVRQMVAEARAVKIAAEVAKQEIDKHRQKATEMEKKMQEAEQRAKEMADKALAIEKKLQQQEKQLALTEKEMQEQQQMTEDNLKELLVLEEKVKNLEREILTKDDKLAGLAKDVTHLSQQVEMTTVALTQKANEVETLKTSLVQLAQTITSLETINAANQQTLSENTVKLNVFKDKCTTLESRCASLYEKQQLEMKSNAELKRHISRFENDHRNVMEFYQRILSLYEFPNFKESEMKSTKSVASHHALLFTPQCQEFKQSESVSATNSLKAKGSV